MTTKKTEPERINLDDPENESWMSQLREEKKAKTPPSPGKFEKSGEVGEQLWELTLNGALEEECGGVTEHEYWCGLLIDTGIPEAKNAVVFEDQQGFVEYLAYETEAEAREAWEHCLEQVLLGEEYEDDNP